MRKRIYIISRNNPNELPPVLSLGYAAQALGFEVIIVSRNIKASDYPCFQVINIAMIDSNKIKKILNWIIFKIKVQTIISKIIEPDLIWISGADTAKVLGASFLSKRKFYFQINELYDKFPNYLKCLSEVMKISYKNIVPQEDRAKLFHEWFSLDSLPCVLYNKPYFNVDVNLELDKNYLEYFQKIVNEKEKGKKIVIYQGHIDIKDRDLSPLLKVFNAYDDVVVVLMGKDYNNSVQIYRDICDKIIYVPQVNAPNHLLFTSICDIGILSYLPVSLNNIYCAPNKVWEYAKYGLVQVGNNIEGLRFLEKEQIGVVVDFNNPKECNEKVKEVMGNIDIYKKNALTFFNNYDFKIELNRIIVE